MKKILFIIGGLIIVTALVVSFIQWNTEVDTTTEKAKEDLTEMKEKKPEAVDADPHPPATNESEDAGNQDGATGNQDRDQETPSSSNENYPTTPNEVVDPKDQGNSKQQGSIKNDDNVNEPSPANNNAPKTEEKTEGKSLTEIKSAYRKIFTDLEIQETSKVDQLLVQAKADHVSGEYSKQRLVEKYGTLTSQLERQADRSFNAIYYQLQTELNNQGYNQNEATPFRNEYNSKKEARRSHAISQLQGF